MDLCGLMRVASINGKKYLLVIVDDYSRYTWVYFFRSKDETPEIIKKFIAQAQLNYKAKVCKIRTDNVKRRARDMYHNLQDDDIMKNIFNSERHKNKPTKFTHEKHKTTSTPRSPNPDKEAAESSAPRRSTVIRLRIPKRRSTCLTPPAPVPTIDKVVEMILQDTLQVSLAEHKSHKEQEARENVALVEKMVDGQENIVDDSSILRNDGPNIPDTRIKPRSNKESPEVEITKDKEVEITKETPVVEITNVVILVNVNDDDEEITDEVYELKRMEKGKLVEETRNSPIPTPIRSPRIHTTSSSSSPHKS
ncbi:retrovirus-related pol polyprotein from transposon TNT 1-94 [Tanacetum coccineum]